MAYDLPPKKQTIESTVDCYALIDRSVERTYPYIGRCTRFDGKKEDTIVLFTSPKTGVCIASEGQYQIGMHCDTWVEEWFDKTLVAVTLKNRICHDPASHL